MTENKYINKLEAVIRLLGNGDSSSMDLKHINIDPFKETASKKTIKNQILATLREIKFHLEDIEK